MRQVKVTYLETHVEGPGHADAAHNVRMFDLGLRYLALMNVYSEHFCRFFCSFNHKCYQKRMETADL